MSFRFLQFDGVECITILRGNNVFYLHDQNTKKSYREEEGMTNDEMEQRVRKLNKRINFTMEAVRKALFESQPVDAKLFSEQENGEPTETDAVLRLKYRLKDAPAPLKWEWHMSRIDDARFYCGLMLLQIGHTVSLGNLQENLVAIIGQKDREIQQYRNEGAVLRRTTVATKPFDGSAYLKQYKSLLDNWQSYGQFAQSDQDIMEAIVVFPLREPNDTIVKVEDGPLDNGALTTLSPRNRKRKALEADQQHVERKALQRRRITKLEYKNSESQEDELKPDYDSAAPQTMLDNNNQEASSTVSNGKGSGDESSATTESESGENGQDDNKEASSTDSNGKGSTDESHETSTESESGENVRDNSLSNIRLHVTGDSEDKEDNDDNESKDESKDKKDEQVDGGTKKAEGSDEESSGSSSSSSSGSSSSSSEDKEKNKEKDEDSDSKAKGDGKLEDKSEKDDNAEGAGGAEETTMSTSETDANNKENVEE